MTNLLQNGNFSFSLVYRRHSDLSKFPLLRKSLYDFDSDIFARFKTPCQLDLPMHSSTDLVDDFILIYQFAARELVVFDLCLVGPVLHVSVLNDVIVEWDQEKRCKRQDKPFRSAWKAKRVMHWRSNMVVRSETEVLWVLPMGDQKLVGWVKKTRKRLTLELYASAADADRDWFVAHLGGQECAGGWG